VGPGRRGPEGYLGVKEGVLGGVKSLLSMSQLVCCHHQLTKNGVSHHSIIRDCWT
jgi:hypothetical protein